MAKIPGTPPGPVPQHHALATGKKVNVPVSKTPKTPA